MKAHLATLPKDRAGYGLVHQDAHGATSSSMTRGDHAVRLRRLRVLLVPLRHCDGAVLHGRLEDDPALTRAFMAHFLRGYARENRLDRRAGGDALVPEAARDRPVRGDPPTTAHVDDWWPRRYMEGRRARIERDAPFVDFDFAELATFL
ncbi:MAG: hypothetical protein M5R40_14780 [Anaerolineae bacterium]|nr:hypothetical protein [Anaerolineae bacterium]